MTDDSEQKQPDAKGWEAIKATQKWFEKKFPHLHLAEIHVWDTQGKSSRTTTRAYEAWCEVQVDQNSRDAYRKTFGREP